LARCQWKSLRSRGFPFGGRGRGLRQNDRLLCARLPHVCTRARTGLALWGYSDRRGDRQSLAATKLKDAQSIAQAHTSLATAEQSLQATLAANEAKAAPPTRSTVVSAENSVLSARLTVENARKALVLENPLEGPKFTGGLTQNASTANSAYNGVVVSAEHRMSHEFSILANYTYSHCLDMFENGENVSATYQNPANPRGDWGNCSRSCKGRRCRGVWL